MIERFYQNYVNYIILRFNGISCNLFENYTELRKPQKNIFLVNNLLTFSPPPSPLGLVVKRTAANKKKTLENIIYS